jgi:hypothetical protein
MANLKIKGKCMSGRNHGFAWSFLSAIFAISGCSTFGVNQGELTFSTLGCSKPVRFSPDALVVDSAWSNGVFEVKVKNQVLCSAKIKNPSFKIENNIINLAYDADISGGASKCYCESSSRFDLINIVVRDDYQVNFHVNYKY